MSKEHAYAYEAGYRDGSIHYELEHCPACKNVADLQEALADNARLRELLLDVHALGCSGFDCTECPIAFAERCNDEYSGCEWVSILTDRMRELGIEVDA